MVSLNQKNTDSVVEDQDSFNKGEIGDILTVCTTSYANTWIFDTSTSHHMTFSCSILVF